MVSRGEKSFVQLRPRQLPVSPMPRAGPAHNHRFICTHGGNRFPYLPAPQVASVSESVHSSRSFTFPSVSGDYNVWGQIHVASGLAATIQSFK